MVDAFRVADDVLRQGVQGISRPDHAAGPDQPRLRRRAHDHVRGRQRAAGHRHGHGRASARRTPPQQAVSSPLLETTLEGARSILLSITGGRDLSLWEVNEAAKAVAGGRAPGREHHLRRDGRREARRPGVGHGRRDRLRRRGRATAARRRSRSRRASRASSAAAAPPAPPSAARRLGVDVDVPEFIPRRLAARRRHDDRHDAACIAAGHPLTAEAGADVLRAGGNAVDAARGRDARVVRGRAAADRARRRRLHARRARRRASRCCWTSSSRRPATAPTRRRARRSSPVDVSFGDARAGVPHRRRLVRRLRHAGRDLRGARALGHASPLAELAAPAAALARDGVRGQRGAGLRVRDARADPAQHAEVARRCSRRDGRGRCARATVPLARAGRDDRALRRRGRGAVLHRRHRRGGARLRRAARRPAHGAPTSPPTRRSCASRCASATAAAGADQPAAAARAAPARGQRSRSSTRTPGPPSPRAARRRDGAHRRRTPEFLEGCADPGSRVLPRGSGSTTHISVLDGDGWACSVTCTNGEGSGDRRARAPASTSTT